MAGLVGAAAAWPVALRARPRPGVAQIGVLCRPLAPDFLRSGCATARR